MILTVCIPEERKAVLIGRKGKIKKFIEKQTNTKIIINNNVEIKGSYAEKIYKAMEIVKAIGRGFSPETAFNLLDDENQLNIITLKSETKKTITRLMARVIGRNGSAKKKIEMFTDSHISVFGKTVAIISKWDKLDVASKNHTLCGIRNQYLQCTSLKTYEPI